VSGTGADGQPVTLGGISTDVLRRQAAGDWRYAIDQPWGDQMIAP
jgi:ketosteroid isomerase-like protein